MTSDKQIIVRFYTCTLCNLMCKKGDGGLISIFADIRVAAYARSGFLQDDITVANQLRWELSEIASGVIRFKSTVDIRRSDMKAPKADRIMRTQAKRSNAHKRIAHTCTTRSRDILEPSGGFGHSHQIFTSIFRRSLILALACPRIDLA